MITQTLPPYVVINDPNCPNKDVLTTPAQEVSFPLDQEVVKIIEELEKKFNQEENCAGLAAPQIGYGKRIIIVALPEDEELKKFRPDFVQSMPQTILINPIWVALSEEKTIDWEACFSVQDLYGRVARFTEISYQAWTPAGKYITGNARGLLARLLQHECDHLNGKLFIDYVDSCDLKTREQARQSREEEKKTREQASMDQ